MRLRRALSIALVLGPLAAASAPVDAQVDESWLAEVARSYRGWGRVDDELRWAPFMCRMPMPSQARVSQAEGAAHARKVYFLYATHRDQYVAVERGGRRRIPRGFTVVKEAFHPRPGATPSEVLGVGVGVAMPGALLPQTEAPEGVGLGPGSDIYRPLTGPDGRAIGAGAARGLYVMRYVGRRRGTDAGWIYGTVDAEGRVTGEGRMESCMGCHRRAPGGRLFGL